MAPSPAFLPNPANTSCYSIKEQTRTKLNLEIHGKTEMVAVMVCFLFWRQKRLHSFNSETATDPLYLLLMQAPQVPNTPALSLTHISRLHADVSET